MVYPSADGTPVRMVVSARPGTGPRPAILTGYGGFGLSAHAPATPATPAPGSRPAGLRARPACAAAARKARQWHRDGMLDRKQNVFDDFTAAAEKLIADGWTTAGQLAVCGESNGGLLVGAAVMTQRPDLFAAAVCSAPLLDMVRYERSGLGPSWRSEYGSADDPEQLGWLLGLLPLPSGHGRGRLPGDAADHVRR